MGRNVRAALLASAASAALAATATGVQAQETEPIEYVRICDAFGSGFFYIPGTDTCLRVGGYIRGDLVDGPDYRIRGFAFEPQRGQLQNPAFDFTIDTDGHRISAGFNLARIAGLSTEEAGTILRNLTIGVDYLEVEGRAFVNGGGGFNTIEGRALPNFGIPGVGQDFGVFIPFPTNVISSGSVQVERWGVRGEAAIDPFAGRFDFNLHPAVNSNLLFLFGIQAGRTETDIVHTAWANTPLFGNVGDTWARYGTRIEERSITPYVGLSLQNETQLTDATKLHFGGAVRFGPSFIEVEVHDSLRARGLGNRIDVAQDIHLSSSDTLYYGSLSGMVGISGGPIKVSLIGMAEHGLLNQPNLFRQDSVEVSPGKFETVPTRADIKEDWTYSAGLRLSVSFGGR